MLDRRTFLASTGAVLLAAPLGAQAQQAGKVYRIGVLEPLKVGQIGFLPSGASAAHRRQLEQHVPFVRARLKRAGIRLAHLLNTTLGQ